MMVPNPEARAAPSSCPLAQVWRRCLVSTAWNLPASLSPLRPWPALAQALTLICSPLLPPGSFLQLLLHSGIQVSLWKTVLILVWPLCGYGVRSRPFAAWPEHVWVHLGWLCLPWTPSYAEQSGADAGHLGSVLSATQRSQSISISQKLWARENVKVSAQRGCQVGSNSTAPYWQKLCKRPLRVFFTQGDSFIVLFSCSVVSESLWPYGLQHSRLPCPSPSPKVCSNSFPLSQWCCLTTSSSVVPFFSHPQSFPASGAFPVSRLFPSGGKNIGASASVFPVNIQGWFPLGLTGLIFLQSKGLSRVFSNATVWKYQFFSAQLSLWSNCCIHTWLLEKP